MGCAASVQMQPVSFTRVLPSSEAEPDAQQGDSVQAEKQKPQRQLECAVKNGVLAQDEDQKPERQTAQVFLSHASELEVKQRGSAQSEAQTQENRFPRYVWGDKYFHDRASSSDDSLQGEPIENFIVNTNIIPEPSRAVSLNSYSFIPSSENYARGRRLPPCAPCHVKHLRRFVRALKVVDVAPEELEDLIARRRKIFDRQVKFREWLEEHQMP